MAKIHIPFDKAGELGSGLPDGKYALKITGAQLGETQKGDQKLVVRHIVIAPKKFKGTPVSISFTYNPVGLALLREMITAATGKEVAKKAVTLDTKILVGRTYQAEAYTSKRDNGEFLNWRNFKPLGTASDDDEEPEEEELEEEEEVEDEDEEDNEELTFFGDEDE